MQPMKLPGPKARALVKRDSAVISPSYARGYPFVMDHGKGVEAWDVDGNRYLDFMGGIAVLSTGPAHARRNFIGFTGAFHGRTMGAVTFTASKPSYHGGFYPLMNGVVHAPFPNPYRPVLATRPGEDYGATVVREI